MTLLTDVGILLVALLHLYFLVLEMFLWTRPLGLRTFGRSLEEARASATLAANQGLYNGFLAAGLLWGLVHPDPAVSRQIRFFFLACVSVAGVYGGATVGKKVLLIQALPAALLIVVLALT